MDRVGDGDFVRVRVLDGTYEGAVLSCHRPTQQLTMQRGKQSRQTHKLLGMLISRSQGRRNWKDARANDIPLDGNNKKFSEFNS